MPRALFITLALAFPLTVHLAVLTDSQALTVTGLCILAALVLLPGLLRGRMTAVLGAVVVSGCSVLLLRHDLLWLPLYAQAVLGDLFAAWLFGHTLTARRVPLLTRIVRLLHPPDEVLTPQILAYTRRLTLLWMLLFLVLGAASLALALCAVPNGILLLLGRTPPLRIPQTDWSLFANLLEYLLVAACLVLEYAWRRRRFPRQPYANFFDFARRLIRVAPQALSGARRGEPLRKPA